MAVSYALFSPGMFPSAYYSLRAPTDKSAASETTPILLPAAPGPADAVKRSVVSASIYPMLLGIVGGLVMLFLLVYVVPRFSHIYADIGSDLPLMSQLLMRWGQLLESHGAAILAGSVLVLGGAFHAATRPARQRSPAALRSRLGSADHPCAVPDRCGDCPHLAGHRRDALPVERFGAGQHPDEQPHRPPKALSLNLTIA